MIGLGKILEYGAFATIGIVLIASPTNGRHHKLIRKPIEKPQNALSIALSKQQSQKSSLFSGPLHYGVVTITHGGSGCSGPRRVNFPTEIFKDPDTNNLRIEFGTNQTIEFYDNGLIQYNNQEVNITRIEEGLVIVLSSQGGPSLSVPVEAFYRDLPELIRQQILSAS